MATSDQSLRIEVSAYDGVVIFKGLGSEAVVLTPEAAERLGYNLSAAAYAAAHDAVRTWREEMQPAAANERRAPARRSDSPVKLLREPRSFRFDDLPPTD